MTEAAGTSWLAGSFATPSYQASTAVDRMDAFAVINYMDFVHGH